MKAISDLVRDIDRAASARIAYKATVDVAAKGVMLVVTIAAARRLPRDAFGVLALAMTTGWLLGVASDMGLPMYLARAAARQGREVGAALSAVARLRWLLAALATAFAAGMAWQWAPSGQRLAFTLVAFSQIAAATLETAGHALRGLDRAELESHVHLAQRLGMGAAALAVLSLEPASLTALGLALAVPPVLAMPAILLMTSTIVHAAPDRTSQESHETQDSVWLVLRQAAPLGIGVLLSALYFRIDVFFLEQWHGLASVAGYSAVFRIVDAVRLVPAAILAVTFPALCRARNASLVGRIGTGLTLGGLAVAGLIALGASALVATLYGPRYADASPVLRLLAAAVPLFFLNYALTHQVIGWDGQRAYLGIAAAALVANIAANAALVPPYGASGAAVATTLTELVVTVGCLRALADTRRAKAPTPDLSPRGAS